MILLIDNYDSFTYNLAHLLSAAGAARVEVKRNDELSAADALAMGAEAIVLSPGPCTPDEAGICVDLVRENAGATPILGVCLGHQAIAQAYGGRIVRAQTLMHGKTSTISHNGAGIFTGVPDDFLAARYHSLAVEPDSAPDCLAITARTDDGEIMALHHAEHPVFGVQFHPESIASDHGRALTANFLAIAEQRRAA